MQNTHAPARRGIFPLLSLIFFMADMQAGIGPFLGVFLLAHGWQSGLIGTVMTVGGVAGMVMTTPAGALVDATRRKKLYVIIPEFALRRFRSDPAFAKFLARDVVAGRDRHRRRCDRPSRCGHHAGHGASSRLQPAERP